jgi:hypothetical protein
VLAIFCSLRLLGIVCELANWIDDGATSTPSSMGDSANETPARPRPGDPEFLQFLLIEMTIYADRWLRREAASNQHPRQVPRTKRHFCLIFIFSRDAAA